MAITFSIRFMDENDDPIDGANVKIYDIGILGQTYHGFTDGDGWAEFEVYNVSGLDIGEVSVSKGVNSLGTVECDLHFEDGDTASITVPDA